MPKASDEKPVAVWGAIVANLAIAIAKFVAAAITGSSATFAEGIHSVVDTGNELLLLLGIRRSKQQADALHPFGYGNELYFWSLVVAMLLFAIGGGMSTYEGVRAFLHPAPARDVTWNYVVLGTAFVAEGTSWLIALRSLRRGRKPASLWRHIRASKDPSKFLVVGEDTAALAGLVVALVGTLAGQLTHSHIPDACASIVIGLLLCGMAGFLTLETKDLLIGESARAELIEELTRAIGQGAVVTSLKPPMTMHLGPHQVLVNAELMVSADASVQDLVAHLDRVEAELRARFPQLTRVYVRPSTASAPQGRHDQKSRLNPVADSCR
jgi:cation diffusion facilitator family transporter